MKLKCLLLTTCLFALIFSAEGQKKWSLRECIDYARQENIQVKKLKLSTDSYEIDSKQAKAELFPSLTGTISQSYNHAKNASNDYHYQGLFNGQYGLNLNWTVFDGKQNLNNIKQTKLQKEIGVLNTETEQNDLEVSITQIYLQLLYARESIKNNLNIVEASELQLKQTKDFLDVGNITKAEYAQVEAQYSSDKYNLTLAENSFDNYKLQLKQLLELDIDYDFDIMFPDIKDEDIQTLIPSKQDVYRTALSIMPEIKGSYLNIDIAKVQESSAKGGYLPTISLNGSLGTSNVWNSSYPSFSTQINRNFNQYIGLSVSVPIFDNFRNRSTVQKSKIQTETAQLNYTDAQKTLLRTIESLHQDAISAQSKYYAAKDKLTSSELSYTLVKEQYALGMRNTVELTTEQNNYANSLQDLLQAKYAALLSIKLLNFYQGIEISL